MKRGLNTKRGTESAEKTSDVPMAGGLLTRIELRSRPGWWFSPPQHSDALTTHLPLRGKGMTFAEVIALETCELTDVARTGVEDHPFCSINQRMSARFRASPLRFFVAAFARLIRTETRFAIHRAPLQLKMRGGRKTCDDKGQLLSARLPFGECHQRAPLWLRWRVIQRGPAAA
jgi:hypothetical protein